jgi:hypothetical protein
MVAFPPGLVWLASYPKSGNTWMRVLLHNLMAGSPEPADINVLWHEETLVGRWRFGDDMLVDSDLLHWRELESLRPLHCDFVADTLKTAFFYKTHDRFTGRAGQPVLGTRARAALYLVRDPRDVAISLSHHAGISLDRAIAVMMDEARESGGGIQVRYLQGDWAGHVSGWTGQDLIPTKIVRYEDLRSDTVAAVTEALTFLGGTGTEAEIERAVVHSRLSELQRQEAARGFREARPGQRFFRSGRIGEWREVLTASQRRLIEEWCGPLMLRLGYAPGE